MYGELENRYFVRCRDDGAEQLSQLEELLLEQGAEVQHRYESIFTIAAVIKNAAVVELLKEQGYALEPQHELRQLDTQ